MLQESSVRLCSETYTLIDFAPIPFSFAAQLLSDQTFLSVD
jgi:hypothetical protein